VSDSALRLLHALVVDDQGTRWGERATDLQDRDARALLDADAPRRHWVGRSRGYSKTDDLAAITVVVLLEQLRPGDEALAVAADRDQAAIIVRRIRWIAARTPELSRALEVGAYDVRTRSGVKFECLSADAASSWGRSPRWAVVDELCQHPETPNARTLWESISTACVKVQGRLAVITTAGDPSHWSRAVYEHALKDEAWRVSEAHGPAPWLPPEEVEAERRRLPESSFRRLFRNEWVATEDRLLSPEDVRACAHLAGPLDRQPYIVYVVGVDLAVRRDRAVVAVAHSEPLDGTEGVCVVVDHLDVFRASGEHDIDLEQVEGCVEARARTYNGAAVIFDPAMAHSMMQRLTRAGVRVIEHTFSAQSNSKRALALLELVRSHRLALPDERELIDEFTALRLVERGPGLFRYDHDPGRHDDQVTAIGLCSHHLLEQPSAVLPTPAQLDRLWAPTRGEPWHSIHTRTTW
jgi:Phage Terminase